MPNPLTEEEIALIRRNFKKCTDETLDAIIRFRASRDAAEVATIARGIIRRYLPVAHAGLMDTATAETPLTELHIESLTMLEIILDVQDALEITIEDSELREFKTLGDVLGFLEKKVAASA
jgi:3-hydroxyacyl-[acyl-carrier-protein] dehydratase